MKESAISAGAILILALYFLPSILAATRRHLSATAIFFLNLFLGWTFVGWVAAFVWACTDHIKVNRQREQENLARLIALQTGQGQPVAALPPRSSQGKNLFYLALLIGLVLFVEIFGTSRDKKNQAVTATPATTQIEATTTGRPRRAWSHA